MPNENLWMEGKAVHKEKCMVFNTCNSSAENQRSNFCLKKVEGRK